MLYQSECELVTKGAVLNNLETNVKYRPLVHSTRGGVVESTHYGAAAVVADGGVQFEWGSGSQSVYFRSALKPLQLVAMIRAGLRLPDELLATAAASHSGAPGHQSSVLEILSRFGLTQDALRNVEDLPYGAGARDEALRRRESKSQLAQNCSGKHAAMLATCTVNGWDLESYLDPAHPLQRQVLATLEDLTGESPGRQAIDGCGAPLWQFTLSGIAAAYVQLMRFSVDLPEARVAAAMKAHPGLVGGEGRDVTDLMKACPGLLAKDGAEGVQLVALDDGRALAIKVADGADRARMPAALAVLRAFGDVAIPESLSAPVLGGGVPVGQLVADEGLVAALEEWMAR